MSEIETMNWRARYLQQAAWTRGLRKYLFDQAGLSRAKRILDVGCGYGAILGEIPAPAAPYGLDLDSAALTECKIHAPNAALTRANGQRLPYADKSFDIAYCHYLLLWVEDPLQVAREMARVSRHVIALAEPDYGQRVDEPTELKALGAMQTESLRRQGANPFLGGALAEIFYQAGIKIVETGQIQNQDSARPIEDGESEWDVIQFDLQGIASDVEIQKMKILDRQTRENGKRILRIPTFFAWGLSR
ncbi:MAG: class I SAM-dependent methyltransferase [Anaerolineales bacterium]|nr:class I SAM-dependent methyltransferase [Anaerolineales bacterium]